MHVREVPLLARAIVRPLLDSERTEEIHITEEITGRRHFAAALRSAFDGDEARDLLRARPELCAAQVDYDALRKLPRDTLGFRYVQHLDRNGLSAESQATRTHYVDDPEIAYLMRRFRQTHDVWHALVDLGTRGHEEVILHAFSWGQLRLPVSALVVLFGSVKHLLLEARWGALRRALFEAYRHGRDAQPLLPVYWERHWSDPLERVRARHAIAPCTRTYVDG